MPQTAVKQLHVAKLHLFKDPRKSAHYNEWVMYVYHILRYLHRDDRTMLGQRDRWRLSERRDASAQLGLHPGYDLSVCAVHAACFSLVILSYADQYPRSPCAFLRNHTLFCYLPRFSPVFPLFFLFIRHINRILVL